MIPLQAITPGSLVAAVPGVTAGEARKIIAMVHRGEPVAASSAVRRTAAEAVRAAGHVPVLAVDAELASAIDPFVKYRLTSAGGTFEAVRIPLAVDGRVSVCVSSQVGCALACRFCATGRLGLTRNLEAWEIVEQVRVVRARLPAGMRVHGVVFQGMGEPMANLDAVLAAIEVMSEPCALGIDARAITVSTAGLPLGIRRLATGAPRVRLAVSLGSLDPTVRADLMPITRAHSLAEVIAACADHVRATGRSPMWSLTLLDGVNDSPAHAAALAAHVNAFTAETGRRPRISIIPYNATSPANGEAGASVSMPRRLALLRETTPFARSPPAREQAFRAVLAAAGLPNHKRYSGGGDVAAACGQLAAAVD